MTDHVETQYDDECGWCLHPIKVYALSWQTVKSYISIPIVANYCNAKTECAKEGCELNCSEIALSTPENTEKVLHEMWRRRKKNARLAALEASKANRDTVRDPSGSRDYS